MKNIKYIILLLILSFSNLFAYIGVVKEVYFTPSLDCENLIIKNIKDAKDSVNIVIYSITNKNIVEAIKNSYNRNIKIQIIADRLQSKGKSSKINELINYGIPIVISKKYKIEHNKFTIIDDKIVITGSYNYTANASKYNSENCILIEDNKLKYKNRFNELWKFYENALND